MPLTPLLSFYAVFSKWRLPQSLEDKTIERACENAAYYEIRQKAEHRPCA